MKKICITFLLSMAVCSCYPSSLVVTGRVCDLNEHEDLIGASIRLLSLPDSAFITATTAYQKKNRGDQEEITSYFNITLPSREHNYLLEVTNLGYTAKYIEILPELYNKNQNRIELPLILLSPKQHELTEVTIKTSRIKFFNRGDTVVFNADAFSLPQGSMLDVLISQLPGVEINSNGQIYYNGQYVESLLLDGKKFFNGNNQLMLQNLSAYTVKDIKIYDRLGEASQFAGRELAGDKELVMDVALKKEYSTGLILNTEGGLGTEKRYMGRFFGMWFTNETRLTLYGNINNLNDDRKPGSSSNWNPADLKRGVMRVETGGIDYYVDKKLKGVRINGNAILAHERLNDETSTLGVKFLPSGNIWERSFSLNTSKNLKLTSEHNLYIKRNRYDITVLPKFEYKNGWQQDQFLSASANTVLDNLSYTDIQHLKNEDQHLTSTFINRIAQTNLNRGHSINGSLSVNSIIKVQDTSDIIRLSLGGNYSDTKMDRFNLYDINYFQEPDRNMYLNRYFKNHPDKNSRLSASAAYNWKITEGISLELTYLLRHSAKKMVSMLYNFTEPEDFGNTNSGNLPSMNDFVMTFDKNNSFNSHKFNLKNTLSPFILWNKGNLSGQLRIPLSLSKQKLLYERGIIDTVINKKFFIFNINDTFIQWVSSDGTKKWDLNYSLETESPDLINFVDMIDNVDPMNIYTGNPSLRSSKYHRVSFNGQFINPNTRLMQLINLKFSVIDDALTKGYIYDSATGVKRYMTYNIDGNWESSLGYGVGLQFGNTKQMSLQSLTTGSFVQSVDFIGENDIRPKKSKVVTKGINEILKYSLNINKNTIGISADVSYKNYSGETKMNTWQQQYGISGIFNVTNNLQISSDFNIFIRTGFDDSALNRTDLVWNARLSYSLLKGNLLLMVDGFDMLHKLSNITYNINAQGRTETAVNVLPRYFMFHIQYRFKRQPHKRK